MTDLIEGDCKSAACDGSGNVVLAVDDTDLPPNDHNMCTEETCQQGVPSNPPAAPHTPCKVGVCNDVGVCVECFDATDCPAGANECEVASPAVGSAIQSALPQARFQETVR